jgi:hypothetical protein
MLETYPMNSQRILFLFLLPLTVSCAPPSAVTQDQPERRSIEVALRAPRTEAFNRTMAAFVREGLVVGQGDASSGIVVSTPQISGGMFRLAIVYRANILAVGDTASSVILSGGYTSKDVDQLASATSGLQVISDEKPLTSKMGKTLGKGWTLLEQIAAKLEKP